MGRAVSRRLCLPIPLLPSMRLVQHVWRKKGTFAVYRVEASSASHVTTATAAEPSRGLWVAGGSEKQQVDWWCLWVWGKKKARKNVIRERNNALSCAIWRRIGMYKFSDVSEEHTAFLFASLILRPWRWRQYAPSKVAKHLRDYTASHPNDSNLHSYRYNNLNCHETKRLAETNLKKRKIRIKGIERRKLQRRCQ
jgi:hypothetical protein